MNFAFRFRRLFTLPPDEVVRRITGKVKRPLLRQYKRWHLRAFSSYGNYTIHGDLPLYFPAPSKDTLKQWEHVIMQLVAHYCDHRFDLLGSGWVQVKHGMTCRGVEGYRYAMSGSERRINRANQAYSLQVASLIDKDYVPIDWQLDFKSGYRWSEDTPSFDIRFGDMLGVDVKVPWELARGQHLPYLAYATILSGDMTSYADEFCNQVLDFIAHNPPGFGVNWSCTMDVSIRIVNWLITYDFMRGAGVKFNDDFTQEFIRSVYQHGQFIINNLEWFFDLRLNHYLSNITGLAFVAAYLPASAEIDVWLAFAIQELVSEFGSQFNPDGSNFEASTSYHRLSAEMVIYATALILGLPGEKLSALQNYDYRLHVGHGVLQAAPLPMYDNLPFPQWYFERLEKAAEFSLHISSPIGEVAQIGDNDSGRLLKLTPLFTHATTAAMKKCYANLKNYAELADDDLYLDEAFLDHRHLVAAINGLFYRDDFTAFTTGYHLEQQLIAQVAATRIASYRQGSASAAEQITIGDNTGQHPATQQDGDAQVLDFSGDDLRDGLQHFAYPDFGLYIFRSRRLFMTVRCGDIGQKGSGGHAHNDQLSLVIYVDNKAIIRDAGTYLYTPLPQRRDAYRSQQAHFGPFIDHLEPDSFAQGLFRLVNQQKAECKRFGDGQFMGMYYGYRTIIIDEQAIRIIDYGMKSTPPTTDFPVSPAYGKLFIVGS